jgi:hypothetical protein
MGIDSSAVIEPADNVSYHDLAEGGVLLDVETGEYFSLNAVGREIWKLISGPTRVSDLVSAVADLMAEPDDSLESDVQDFVGSMLERGLVRAAD